MMHFELIRADVIDKPDILVIQDQGNKDIIIRVGNIFDFSHFVLSREEAIELANEILKYCK